MIIDYLSIPYRARGIPPESADCWTLARYFVERELGKRLPEYFYDVEGDSPVAGPLMVRTLADVHGNWLEVAREADWQYGDLLIFRHRGEPWHIGVYLGMDSGRKVFLHTSQGLNSRIEAIDEWRPRLVTVRRWGGG